MITTGVEQAGWCSPTRLWSLLNCPASAGEPPADTTWTASSNHETNAGTLAHNALETWIKSGGFRSGDPRASLAEVADALLPDSTGRPPPRWPMARARLLARAPLLAGLIGSRTDNQILSEVELRDNAFRLHGKPDLVLLGDEVVLLDLKTQTLKHGELPEWVDFQLNLYAHLVRVHQGVRPDSVQILSLNRGLIPVLVTDETILTALDAARRARETLLGDARPAAEVCRFCDRRLTCTPHWDASLSWDSADCVEGVIDRLEVAANGRAAVRVAQAESEAWVSGIPASLLTSARTGERIRVVRVRQASPTPENGIDWRWRDSSALRIQGSATVW